MLSVTFYTYPKYPNSTAIPTEDNGITDSNILLKEGTSKYSPTFIMRWDGDYPIYNMVKAFDCYYSIDDYTMVANHLYEVHCTMDVLATYRDDIANSRQLVGYYHGGNVLIQDSRNPMQDKVDKYRVTGNTFVRDEGYFTISVAGNEASWAGGISNTYALTFGQLSMLADRLWTDDFKELTKDLFSSPGDAIIDCHFVPASLPSGSYTNVHVGNWDLGSPALLLDTEGDDRYKWTTTIDIPFDQAFPPVDGVAQRESYLWYAPFTTIALYLPGVGIVQIDTLSVTSKKLYIIAVLDTIKGDVLYIVKDGSDNGNILAQHTGCVGRQMIVSSGSFSKQTIISAASNVISAGVQSFINLVKSNPLSLLTPFASTRGLRKPGTDGADIIGSSDINGLRLNTSTHGAISSSLILGDNDSTNIWLYFIVNRAAATASEYGSVQGLPYFRTATIRNLAKGYIQTIGAHVRSDGEASEIRQVEALMDGGFYYE